MRQFIYSKNSVLERLKQKKEINKILLVSKHAEIEKLARAQNIEIEYINSKVADKLVNKTHQGVIAEIPDYKSIDLDQLIQSLDMTSNPILVMADQLEDPHNLGAILRTCDAVGVKGVIIPKNRSVGLNSTVARVSTGAIETVPVSIVTNLKQAIDKLKQAGFWIVGVDNTESQDYRLIPSDRPLVIIVGSEKKGISPLLKKECDYRAKIFMLGSVNSLNVSVATAVMLYSIMEKRVEIQIN
ncbi:MAG TPA: 23S rRNA (guanosine(2251)-2'-O)-methyltransferase RlmB [Erysipelothrix sp.]|nr:23S rRNA (guanosine(2251)-2'-O)-methyltransferase RlmB [Erysipelothrix sp.]